MQTISTDVLVIGGGATGSGALRDLAMRGIRAILVEKGDLTHGTTGRYHGLLHSGGRYVTKDPQSANECARENAILRRIMPHCIEDTSGFFVITPWDDPDYGDVFMANCRSAGVPVSELSLAEMRRREPALNPQISRAFEVADASADSFLAAHTNALAAREYGAQVLTYHTLIGLNRVGDQVVGAVVEDLRTGEQKQIDCACVLNATGAWAGKVASLAGVSVTVLPGKGTLVAMNHRMVNTVINRCKLPSDGDIIVPVHSVAVIGTTDTFVPDPDFYGIETEEVQFMLDEGEKLVPGFKQYRALRAWAGVRPLYKDQEVANDRDLSRTYKLLDHAQRDGVGGIISLVGGKWTTYRLMAEDAVNLVAQRLGNTKPCRTAEEVMPVPAFEHRGESKPVDTGPSLHWLGKPLAAIEQTQTYNDLICECELVTRTRLQEAMANGASNIDDLRRMVRVGMGPCQGGWCVYRSGALLYEDRSTQVDFSIEYTNAALLHFLQERWRGLTPVLWGDQLRQARLDELIFAGLLGIQRLREYARQGGGLVTPE